VGSGAGAHRPDRSDLWRASDRAPSAGQHRAPRADGVFARSRVWSRRAGRASAFGNELSSGEWFRNPGRHV
jgi:hypothetical protein